MPRGHLMHVTTWRFVIATLLVSLFSLPTLAWASPETGLSAKPSLLTDYERHLKDKQKQTRFELENENALDGAFAEESHAKVVTEFSEQPLKMPFGLDLSNREPVHVFVKFWQGRGRATLARYLSRMGRYEPMIRQVLAEEGVPEDLIYLCLVESGFSPIALSRANAGGLWQFIPATAVNYGLRIDGQVDERKDPIKATRAAARYLRQLREETGSWPLAMAGYNAGSGHVRRAMEKANSTSYWSVARRDSLVRGARNYVAKILAVALIGMNREVFGFDGVVVEEPVTFERISVPGGTALAKVAETLDVEAKALKALNPELIPMATPSRVEHYALRIPPGSRSKWVADLGDGDTQETVYYDVRVGESLEMIADGLGVPVEVLEDYNDLDRDRPAYGARLVVPKWALADNPAYAEVSSAAALPPLKRQTTQHLVALLPSVQYAYADKTRYFYHAQQGDRLGDVAKHLGLNAQVLRMWNDLEGERLIKGQVLQVFVDPENPPQAAVLYPESAVRVVEEGDGEYSMEYGRKFRKRWAGSARGGGKTYRVKRGDTIRRIARKFGVRPSDLARWNNLGRRRLKVGYRLVIYGAKSKGAPRKARRVAKRPRRRKVYPRR